MRCARAPGIIWSFPRTRRAEFRSRAEIRRSRRHLVRALIPDSMAGYLSFSDVLNTPVDFDASDRKDSPTRIRAQCDRHPRGA